MAPLSSHPAGVWGSPTASAAGAAVGAVDPERSKAEQRGSIGHCAAEEEDGGGGGKREEELAAAAWSSARTRKWNRGSWLSAADRGLAGTWAASTPRQPRAGTGGPGRALLVAGAEWNGFGAHFGFSSHATIGSASRRLEATTLYSASPQRLFTWEHEPAIVASRLTRRRLEPTKVLFAKLTACRRLATARFTCPKVL